MITPSNNDIKGMHWQVYKKLRKSLRDHCFVAAKGGSKGNSISPAFLVISRNSAKTMDWDNVYGGLKPLLDCLVQPSSANPDGLGYIVNDDVTNMPYPPYVIQGKAPPGKGSMTVKIYRLDLNHSESDLGLPINWLGGGAA